MDKLEISKNPSALRQYLKDVYTLEKNWYCSWRATEELDKEIEKCNKQIENCKMALSNLPPLSPNYPKHFAGFLKWFFESDDFFSDLFLYRRFSALPIIFVPRCLLVIIATIVSVIGYRSNENIAFILLPVLVFIGTVIVYIKNRTFFYKNRDSWQNNAEYMNEARQKKEMSLREELKRLSDVVLIQLTENKRLYNQNMTSCAEALQKLYDMDIIYPKYRNFVAVAQLYEYLESGRCTTLEGYEGAYNLYEAELRQSIIINQLDKIIQTLEEIRDVQYAIYQAIKDATAVIGSVASNSAAVAYSSTISASNTAILSYYAKFDY